jgi:hypothetical protein
MLTDQQIIAAAQEAGLCWPDCWFLVDSSRPGVDISAEWGDQERWRMGQLRYFVELAIATHAITLAADC